MHFILFTLLCVPLFIFYTFKALIHQQLQLKKSVVTWEHIYKFNRYKKKCIVLVVSVYVSMI